jgi:hypothetical protein
MGIQMARIRPRDQKLFYRLVGRWLYAQHRGGTSPVLPSQGPQGWLINVPRSLVDYLHTHGCEIDELPD